MRHVSSRVNVNEEPDACDYQHHDHGELVHLEIETCAECSGSDPIEKWLVKGGVIGGEIFQKLADGFCGCDEGKSGGGERHGVDDLIWKFDAENAVDGRAEQRQQRNDPQMFENGLIGH